MVRINRFAIVRAAVCAVLVAGVGGAARANHEAPQGKLSYPQGKALASGKFGQVWQGVDEAGRKFAVKHVTSAWWANWEAGVHRRIGHHPGWAHFHLQDRHNLVYSWASGENGSDFTPRDQNEAILATLHLARTLSALHAQKFAHQDIKPDNVLVERREDGPAVTLVDFGMAAEIDTRWNVFTGTPTYRAPEQGRLPHYTQRRSDVYATANTLLRWLTGEAPSATTLASVKDPALRALISQATHEQRDQRLYIDDFIARLEPLSRAP